jgi:hypothetical protein
MMQIFVVMGLSLLILDRACILAAAPDETEARTLTLSDRQVAVVNVHPGGTVLSFPAKPSKVVIGREAQFDVQYIENDVALVALTPSATANLFVYMLGRRYTFDLRSFPGRGDRIVRIRDRLDDVFEIDVQ